MIRNQFADSINVYATLLSGWVQVERANVWVAWQYEVARRSWTVIIDDQPIFWEVEDQPNVVHVRSLFYFSVFDLSMLNIIV